MLQGTKPRQDYESPLPMQMVRRVVPLKFLSGGILLSESYCYNLCADPVNQSLHIGLRSNSLHVLMYRYCLSLPLSFLWVDTSGYVVVPESWLIFAAVHVCFDPMQRYHASGEFAVLFITSQVHL